jgi:hypothetical protein
MALICSICSGVNPVTLSVGRSYKLIGYLQDSIYTALEGVLKI